MQRSTQTYLIAAVSSAWFAAVVLAFINSPGMTPWEHIVLTVAGAGSVSLAFWPRTTHPQDAWDGGIEEGRRLEREAMDCHPRSGELHVVR